MTRKQKTKTNTDKVKDILPNKIVTEKWEKKKQAKGPGFFPKKCKT